MRNTIGLITLLLHVGCATTAAAPPPQEIPAATPEADLLGARAIFDKNIQAIQQKDKEAYLSTYRNDERLVRDGAEGVLLGYGSFAADVPATGSDDWPEKLIADDAAVQWVSPGVVYGTYRYRVTIKGVTTSGVSERVFLKGKEGWKIAVTTAFETPGDAP
jgi:hypothetical protein